MDSLSVTGTPANTPFVQLGSRKKSTFVTPLRVEPINEKDWKLLETFQYDIGFKGSGVSVIVPEGYVTDFASTPQFLWTILPPWGLYGKAAVVHDYLCSHRIILVNGIPQHVSRQECDELFLEAMGVLGVGKFKRTCMYIGVRAYATYKGIK